MKYLVLFCCFFFLVCCGDDDGPRSCTDPTFQGRLAVQGICLNYVIQVVEGEIDPELIEAEWTHEFTGETYTRVFRLGNPCDFPENLKEGDTFDFVVIPEPLDPSCAVCEAYSPTPDKSLNIRVCR
jgi:hypothetical protein